MVAKHTENKSLQTGTYPQNLKVLMVEDNELNRFLAAAVIKKIGWQLDTAENGVQALEKLNTNRYDVILMDIQMPKMDGVETTMKIRAELSAPNATTPIIACAPMTAEFTKYMEAGMNGHIAKPFSAEELISKVITLIESDPPSTERANVSATGNVKNSEENTIVDLQKLKGMSGISKTTLNSIIQIFLKQVPAQLEHLVAFVAQKDWNSVKALSHKMKSSYAIVGATPVKNLLEVMEADCMENRVDENKFRSLVDEIIALHERVIKSIQAFAA